jgi:signal transduction histidine kinase
MLMAIGVIIFAVTLCLDLAGIYIIRKYMLQRFESRIIFLARYLAVNSEVGVLIRDRSGLNSLAVNLLGEEDVANVMIMDSEENILAEQSRNIPGRLYSIEASIILNKTDEENLLFKEYSNTPFGTLTIRGVDSIGKVRIKYSTRGINILVHDVTMQFIWVSVILASVAGILSHFFVRSIVTDVTGLATVAKMIGGGDLDLRAREGNLPETRELASAFNSMLDSLENSRKAYERIARETSRQRSLAELGKFSLSVAHEVKNPLAIIKTAFEFLQKEYKIAGDNTMANYINDEIFRLNRLIENFLLFAKPGNISFIDVDTGSCMEMLKKRYDMLYDEAPVTLTWQMPKETHHIRADTHLLVQVFDNIIKNAVEASPEGSVIAINAYAENHMWFTEITDQGPGIEKDKEQKIFEPFFTTKSKGTGLGLALASQIIKAHNGIMYAGNNAGSGAVVTLGIPIVKAA